MKAATRTTNTWSRLLDVIFVSATDLIIKFDAFSVNEISDHDMTWPNINIPIFHKEPRIVTLRGFRNNICSLLGDLHELPWHYIITETDLEKILYFSMTLFPQF